MPLAAAVNGLSQPPGKEAAETTYGVGRILGGLGSQRPDCMAGHVGLELRNVAANYPFERAQDLRGSSRILATETIRV
jgi:hypothetical protein